MSKATSIPTPIFKYNPETNICVATYSKVTLAMQENKLTYSKLRRLLAHGKSYNGFVYKSDKPLSKEFIACVNKKYFLEEGYIPHWEGTQLWEGSDGFFNIDGWRKSC